MPKFAALVFLAVALAGVLLVARPNSATAFSGDPCHYAGAIARDF